MRGFFLSLDLMLLIYSSHSAIPWNTFILFKFKKFENQLTDMETLLSVCKVQFNKDRYFISPVTQINAKWKYSRKTSQAVKISPELWNVQCRAAPTAAVMSFWNLE